MASPSKRAPRTRPTAQIPADIEEHRDEHWHRQGDLAVSTVLDAERFIERNGLAACLTDARRPGPSLYVAVCGRRDALIKLPHERRDLLGLRDRDLERPAWGV